MSPAGKTALKPKKTRKLAPKRSTSQAGPSTGRLKILIVGVGGQGALTIAEFLGSAALHSKHQVMVGQLHGMSQRGGSVECSVLFGPGSSSFIGNGQADVVLGLEPLEVLRALPRMSKKTIVVMNLGRIMPFSLAIKGIPYPPLETILSGVRKIAPTLFEIDATELVRRTGAIRTLNVAMLGALAGLKLLPFEPKVLWQAIEKGSPSKFVDKNRLAFELGLEAVKPGKKP